MKLDVFDGMERTALDRHIKSITLYYIGAVILLLAMFFGIYATMQIVLERHSEQQNISFLTSNEFIKFQQLTNSTRALMRASADTTVPNTVLDRLIADSTQKISEIRDISRQIQDLHRRLHEVAPPNDLDIHLQNFLDQAERLCQIDNISRRRRYSFWGPIDFAAAADGFIMRGFQDEIQQSFAKSDASIATAKQIVTLLVVTLVIMLLLLSAFVLRPLLINLRAEHEKKKIFEQKLSITARRDGLTGLFNRMSFNQMLDHLVGGSLADTILPKAGKTGDQPFGLLLIDLDHFKAINDTFGHLTGDGLLIEAARRITSALGEDHVAARLGGDEFVVLAPALADNDATAALAARITEILSAPFVIEGHTLSVSGSIGGALFPNHASTARDLFRCADIALYVAKGQRNALMIYDESLMAHRLMESQLRSDLSKAIERHEFLTYYQPKIDIRTGLHVGFEALVRWHHPDRGVLAPGRFLHLLDTASAISAMTEVIVDTVARDIRRWRDAGHNPGSVAINMPEAILISEGGYTMLAHSIGRHGIDWSDVEVEITEDVFMNKHAEQISATIVKLREKGVSVALDDFGTGFASLSSLRDFPFDDIKIDRSFISELGTDFKSEQIVKAMVDLAGNLGKHVVAEGVETEEQIAFLRTIGCVVVQGYFYSKPQPFEVISQGLSAGRFLAPPSPLTDIGIGIGV